MHANGSADNSLRAMHDELGFGKATPYGVEVKKKWSVQQQDALKQKKT